MTREAWLLRAADELRPAFDKAGKPLPENLHISVGFPRGRKAIGQCWQPESAADQLHQIFICPTHDTDLDMLDTLAHELVHAALPTGVGHRRPFAGLCKTIGLEPKPTWKSAGAGPEFREHLGAILQKLGPSSHGQLIIQPKERKQTTRLRLFECCCTPPIKVRTARDDFEAGCHLCGEDFKRIET